MEWQELRCGLTHQFVWGTEIVFGKLADETHQTKVQARRVLSEAAVVVTVCRSYARCYFRQRSLLRVTTQKIVADTPITLMEVGAQ